MRDLFLKKLNDTLQMKKAKLLEQYKRINQVKKQTGEINYVYNELKNYYDVIVDMKEKQDSAFTNILSHLEKLKTEQHRTDDIIKDLLKEQERITNEKNKVKNELDEIIIAENQ